ncbi:histidine decarboxylase [Pseudofrancisella aestuarii]|uniref:Histidine decarboxylase n=1 Tax=Pseudofrancisella aestuarii TaxID=2670347 RepID=A0ABV9TBF7_9GAMM|nr:histidine decarboxylase [Pseudofrancisella aestuarii]
MKYVERLKHNSSLYIGYPPATDFELSQYAELLDYSMNSLGDPYMLSNPFSSHAHEKAIIDFFIGLYELDINKYWGYLANCSSEAILYCLWKARDYLKQHKKDIKVICNRFSHYSIDKAVEILDIDLIKISSNEYGELNYKELEENIHTDYSYIFFGTIGSTITSSIDDIVKVKSIFNAKGVNHYIHADAAFDGAFIPFTDDIRLCRDFDSINISGHKFIGAPMPSGIMIINKKYVKGEFIEYVLNSDVTIGGSRNGLNPYLLYKRIKQIGGIEGLKNRYFECLNNAKKYEKTLKENDIDVFRYKDSLALVLKNIPKEIMEKWHAPSKGDLTTLTVLPKLTEARLESFIYDIRAYKANKFKLDIKTLMPAEVEKL